MEIIVIESEAFEQLKQEFKCMVKHALTEFSNQKELDSSSDWITLAEAKKLLPYKSKTTWKKFRDKGIIVFSQHQNSRNILYSRKSILNYIEKNKI